MSSILSRLKLHQTPPEPPPDAKSAAVAAVFDRHDHLLLIRRAERDGDPWSGHMAFPGGHREPSDPTLQAAAEREASEEIGLDLSGARLLGSLDMLHPMSQRRRFALFVVPFVYQLEDWPPLSPGPEVADVHTFSLSRLVAGEGRGEMDYHWEGVTYKLPCIRLEGTLIWGMTLRMIDDLLGRLHA